MNEPKIVGLTKDAGFQIGVRKTFPVAPEKAWSFMFSPEGLKIWLGTINSSELELNKTFNTNEGIEGFVKVFKHLSHIRMFWKKQDWENVSLLQIRVINTKGKATISFHQDKLCDSKQRAEMKSYWDNIMENLTLNLIS